VGTSLTRKGRKGGGVTGMGGGVRRRGGERGGDGRGGGGESVRKWEDRCMEVNKGGERKGTKKK